VSHLAIHDLAAVPRRDASSGGAQVPDVVAVGCSAPVYHESLSAFGGAADPLFDDIDGEVLAVLASARSSLRTLYKGYFAMELTQKPLQQSLAAAFSEAEHGFVQLLTDFEVVPGLASGASAHAVFRKVTESRRIPDDIVAELSSSCKLLGRNFTYAHFVVAIALSAQKCFADSGPRAVRRFFEWMDSSKGRVVFSGAFPGVLAAGATLRLAAGQRGSEDDQNPPASQRPHTASVALGSGRAGESKMTGSEFASPVAASSQGSGAETPATRQRGMSFQFGADARRRSVASRGAAQVAVASLPETSRRVVAHVFGHYASLGDPLNRSNLSSLKFNRLLRDCGILSSDGSDGLAFVPEQRRRSSGVADGGGGGGGDATNRSRMTPISESGPRRSLRFSVSSASALLGELPLRVFQQPPMSRVDADLVFVQAVKVQDTDTAQAAKPGMSRSSSARSSLGGSPASKQAGASQQQRKGRAMTIDGFAWALADIAARTLCPQPDEGDGLGVLEEFCRRVLAPLQEAHGEAGAGGADRLTFIVEFLSEPQTERLLQRCSAGLEKVFRAYAMDNGRPHWNSDSLSKFAQDFELAEELTRLPLQRIFQDCVQHESCNGGPAAERGELSAAGLPLALAMISQKVYMAAATIAPMDRLLTLFARLNGVAALPAFSARLGLQSDSLLPIPRVRRSSSQPVVERPRSGSSRKRDSEGEMSWADLMAAN